MTADQIIDEVRHWPESDIYDLAERLAQTIHGTSAVEESWRRAVRMRIAEIENGSVHGIPGEEVSDRIRRIVGK